MVAAFGAGARWRRIELEGVPEADPSAAAAAAATAGDDEEKQRAATVPQVQAVLDVFGGSVAAVTPARDDHDESEESE